MQLNEFYQLDVWQRAKELMMAIYKSTDSFPTTEKYGFVSQMRRSSLSVSSNIAEGFGRRKLGDKKRFYDIASGSLSELKSQLYLCEELSYISKQEFAHLWEIAEHAHKLLNKLITSIDLKYSAATRPR